MGKSDELNYLNDERIKLWEEVRSLQEIFKSFQAQLIELRQDVSKKTSDYEQEARTASGNATRLKNKAGERLKEAEAAAAKVTELCNEMATRQNELEAIQSKYTDVLSKDAETRAAYLKISTRVEELTETASELAELLESAESNLALSQTKKEQIEELEVTAKTAASRVNNLQTQIIKRAKDVTELYDQIFGYEHEDEETGDIDEVEGLKAELETAYETLKTGLDEAQEWIGKFRDEQESKFGDFKQEKAEEISGLKKRITDLLPEALTAGLASAYQEKREAEEVERGNASKLFNRTIVALGIISLIPIGVSLYNLSQDVPLEQVIKDLPNLAFAILPLYFPVFWLALSANKRIKLSKRLIEEYAHKEALSKTYEGLSTQISKIEDGKMAKDLRSRLLYNMVSLSAENPGTLIPDFHESDNPLFEALNKSMALSESLEKFTKIPGVQLILNNINKKIEAQGEKVEASVKAAVVVDELEEDG